jgi:type VI secretion system secreted protein Hcp
MAIYMKFGKVDGQVTTAGFEKWIELYSFQIGVGRGVTSGAGGQKRESSAPSISEVTITKNFDVASSGLFNDAVAGTFNTKVEVKFTTTSKDHVETFLAYELTDCGVSGYSVTSGGDNPSESLSLNFTKILFSPTPLDNAGTPKAGAKISYDLIKMKAS